MPLCPSCDRDDPAAQGLLAFFAVHQAVADDELLSVAVLITEWIDRIAARDRDAGETSDAALGDDYLRWVDGDL